MIEVKDLVKRYGDHTAVDHLSFTMEPGQIYGFLGPNGAGKSTTMNIMTGYIGATSGEVIINGHDIYEEPEEAKKCIGYLPELPPLYTDMSVEEYLKFAAELKRIPKAERKGQVEQVMNLCRLQDVRQRMVGNLSKGYKQRVGMAQAILGFPEVIILDEPTVGLDPKQIIEVRSLMRMLAKEHTVVLSSHILSEVQEVCDTILIINKGKLLACDTPEALERRFAGGNRVELTVKGSRTEAEAIAKAVPGAQGVTSVDNDGTVDLVITAEGGTDIREALFFAFADARMPILTMKRTETTLESVFLQLTADSAASVEEELPESSESEEEVPDEAAPAEETGSEEEEGDEE